MGREGNVGFLRTVLAGAGGFVRRIVGRTEDGRAGI
jgi:hypothetical protein